MREKGFARERAPKFEREVDLCAAFIEAAAKSQPRWKMYSESEGWDILAVRDDGLQVGIEAKLKLNATVVAQSLPSLYSYAVVGPDYRAVLVSSSQTDRGLIEICGALGVAVISQRHPDECVYGFGRYMERLPDEPANSRWHEWAPDNRCRVPEYVPDVAAGASAPLQLTRWKVQAIRLAILLERRPLSRSDFRSAGVDPGRWTSPIGGWLVKTEQGFVAGRYLPDFKRQHPVNYDQIKADLPKWDWTTKTSGTLS